MTTPDHTKYFAAYKVDWREALVAGIKGCDNWPTDEGHGAAFALVGSYIHGGAPNPPSYSYKILYEYIVHHNRKRWVAPAYAELKTLWLEWAKELGVPVPVPESESSSDGISLKHMKPFDFQKTPKRIEIRSNMTIFREIEW